MVNPQAEEKKELGNQAFAQKNYGEAIEHYNEAIGLDSENHVYYSNRSACHAGLGRWEEAAADAAKCVELDPSFVKGYYRRATALIELGQWDDALRTVKSGLRIDVDNAQLLRQQRTIRANKASQRQRDAAHAQRLRQQENGGGGNGHASGGVASASLQNEAANREVMDLQNQFVETSRECSVVKANIAKSQREQKVNAITISELEKLPPEEHVNMYRGVGKMFMLSDRDEVMNHLNENMEEEKKREADLQSKMEYLERRIKSQQANIQDLIKG